MAWLRRFVSWFIVAPGLLGAWLPAGAQPAAQCGGLPPVLTVGHVSEAGNPDVSSVLAAAAAHVGAAGLLPLGVRLQVVEFAQSDSPLDAAPLGGDSLTVRQTCAVGARADMAVLLSGLWASSGALDALQAACYALPQVYYAAGPPPAPPDAPAAPPASPAVFAGAPALWGGLFDVVRSYGWTRVGVVVGHRDVQATSYAAAAIAAEAAGVQVVEAIALPSAAGLGDGGLEESLVSAEVQRLLSTAFVIVAFVDPDEALLLLQYAWEYCVARQGNDFFQWLFVTPMADVVLRLDELTAQLLAAPPGAAATPLESTVLSGRMRRLLHGAKYIAGPPPPGVPIASNDPIWQILAAGGFDRLSPAAQYAVGAVNALFAAAEALSALLESQDSCLLPRGNQSGLPMGPQRQFALAQRLAGAIAAADIAAYAVQLPSQAAAAGGVLDVGALEPALTRAQTSLAAIAVAAADARAPVLAEAVMNGSICSTASTADLSCGVPVGPATAMLLMRSSCNASEQSPAAACDVVLWPDGTSTPPRTPITDSSFRQDFKGSSSTNLVLVPLISGTTLVLILVILSLIPASQTTTTYDDWLMFIQHGAEQDERSKKRVGASLRRQGREMFGNLDIVAFIGSGSFGSVYKGVWNNEVVAIKVISVDDPQTLQNAAHEALLSKRLAHPNIVRTLAFSIREGGSGGRQRKSLSNHQDSARSAEMAAVRERWSGRSPFGRRGAHAGSTATSATVGSGTPGLTPGPPSADAPASPRAGAAADAAAAARRPATRLNALARALAGMVTSRSHTTTTTSSRTALASSSTPTTDSHRETLRTDPSAHRGELSTHSTLQLVRASQASGSLGDGHFQELGQGRWPSAGLADAPGQASAGGAPTAQAVASTSGARDSRGGAPEAQATSDAARARRAHAHAPRQQPFWRRGDPVTLPPPPAAATSAVRPGGDTAGPAAGRAAGAGAPEAPPPPAPPEAPPSEAPPLADLAAEAQAAGRAAAAAAAAEPGDDANTTLTLLDLVSELDGSPSFRGQYRAGSPFLRHEDLNALDVLAVIDSDAAHAQSEERKKREAARAAAAAAAAPPPAPAGTPPPRSSRDVPTARDDAVARDGAAVRAAAHSGIEWASALPAVAQETLSYDGLPLRILSADLARDNEASLAALARARARPDAPGGVSPPGPTSESGSQTASGTAGSVLSDRPPDDALIAIEGGGPPRAASSIAMFPGPTAAPVATAAGFRRRKMFGSTGNLGALEELSPALEGRSLGVGASRTSPPAEAAEASARGLALLSLAAGDPWRPGGGWPPGPAAPTDPNLLAPHVLEMVGRSGAAAGRGGGGGGGPSSLPHCSSFGDLSTARSAGKSVTARRPTHTHSECSLRSSASGQSAQSINNELFKLTSSLAQRVKMECWIILEYCNGGSLDQALAKGLFHPGDVPGIFIILHLCLQVARGVQYLHDQNVYHGDLKAVNVLLSVGRMDSRAIRDRLARTLDRLRNDEAGGAGRASTLGSSSHNPSALPSRSSSQSAAFGTPYGAAGSSAIAAAVATAAAGGAYGGDDGPPRRLSHLSERDDVHPVLESGSRPSSDMPPSVGFRRAIARLGDDSSSPPSSVPTVHGRCDVGPSPSDSPNSRSETGWARWTPRRDSTDPGAGPVGEGQKTSAPMYQRSQRAWADAASDDAGGASPPDMSQDAVPFTAKIADFGVARVMTGTRVQTQSLGTLTHMPPEVLLSGTQSYKMDSYSFGMLMWEIFCASEPYKGMLIGEIVATVLHDGRPTFPPHCPPAYRALAQACWAREPEDRPAIGKVAEELAAMLPRVAEMQTFCTSLVNHPDLARAPTWRGDADGSPPREEE